MEFVYEDCKSLLEQVNLQEKELRHKRRWLIGLPVSRSVSGKMKGPKFQIERTIPEYLLREDDVSYETIKSFVEKGAGGCNTKNKYHIVQDNMQLIHCPRDIKGLLSLVDKMTNEGLFRFVVVLTGGSVKFEKTRWKMKQIIKGCLSEVFSNQSNSQKMILSKHHSLVLNNPENFRWSSESRFIPDSESYRMAVLKMLNVLEDLPTQTLSAMHRKLRGIKGYMPRLTPKKSGWGRDTLIKLLRKKCMGFLSKLGEGDSLQAPLVKAMEVAGLTLKLIRGCHCVTNFKQFSPEINVLQNEIAMSIQLLDQRVKLSVLKDIQVLLDPKAKVLDRTLRASLRTFLTEYLFECSDMDSVPQCLFEVLAIIKQSSETPYRRVSEMKVEEEVECILSVSASTKQVLWDLIPEHELDVEFADAYMEDLEESDGDDICEDIEIEAEHMQSNRCRSSDSDAEVGSTGEIRLANSCSAAFPTREGGYSFDSEVIKSQLKDAMRYHLVSFRNREQMDTDCLTVTNNQAGFSTSSPDRHFRSGSCGQGCTQISEVSSNFSPAERNLTFDNRSIRNQYLAVQAASDETSMVAYRLIGCMLDEFAQIEGCELNSSDVTYLRGGNSGSMRKNCGVARKEPTTHEEDGCSIIIKAVQELIPSFPKCETERLKELMGS